MNLSTLAGCLNLEFKGEPDYVINGVRDIEILSPDQILEHSFIYFIESPSVLKRHPRAVEQGVVLTVKNLAALFPRALIVDESKARLALIKLLEYFNTTPTFEAQVSPQAIVHPSAKISPTATILPGAIVMEQAVIGERSIIYPGVVIEPYAQVGKDSVIYPNAVIGHHCIIGKHCIIHGCAVIGADGFGFYDDAAGRHKIPQIGNVVISDHVEVGASTTIDRATIESTTVGEYTKIDDQVHLGHNCRVGRYVYLVGNTAVGGSVVIEDGAMISGMVIIKDHLKIAKGTIVMGMSGVAQDTEAKVAYFGIPARPARQMHKMNAALERLPDLQLKVRELEEKIKKLETVPLTQ